MSKRFILFTLLTMAAFGSSYRIMDIQNDDNIYTIDDTEEVLIATEELEPTVDQQEVAVEKIKELNLQAPQLNILLDKIEDLADANAKLKQELIDSKNQLIKKRNQKVANVQLESKNPNYNNKQSPGTSFWNYLCGLAKHFIGRFLSLFGVKM